MRSSMVKYSRGQSADAPRRRTCPVIVLPDFSFHSQTFSTNFAAQVVARNLWASSCLSTTICVAMPAWSVPGMNTVSLPDMRW